MLAAGLSSSVRRLLLGVRTSLDLGATPGGAWPVSSTTLDLVCGGRSLLCVAPPFDDPDALREAIGLCRALWRDGRADGGEYYPVEGAVNRPPPFSDGSPLVALDLTAGDEPPRFTGRRVRSAAPPDVRPRRVAHGAHVTDTTVVREQHHAATPQTAVTGRHLPALNGLRGVAVLGVVAYHLQLGWASGGYLGVDLFFVLSGFLISSLLLEEWAGAGRISLAAFWGRRAKRLLPALFLVLVALALYLVLNGRFGGPGANGHVDLSGLRGESIATLLYVNNWHLIFAHQSYFAQFSTPSPLQHTWSLAIEEQFYLVWPLVLLLLLRLAPRAWRKVGMALTVVLGVLSALLMAALFHPGTDPTRVYFGTDTRLFDLMAGATLAFVAASRPSRATPPAGRFTPWGRSPPRRWPSSGSRRARRQDSTELHVRGRVPGVRRAGRPRRGRRPARGARMVLAGAGVGSAALPRDHLLRGLPVALAGDRLPRRRPDRAVGLVARPGARRRHLGRSLWPATTWWSGRSVWPSCTAGARSGRPR